MIIKDFIAYDCPHLTHEQEIVSMAMEGQGRLIGVGKAIGGSDVCPLVSFGHMGYNVIDGAGYYQKANTNSVRLFEEL